jgi:3-isopropylmalate/(R)-2-methylmalate dehydratase small subunit
MILRGKAVKYGDDINTDVIIPARYLGNSDAAFLAAHCMEDIDPDFINKISPGDMIVAGRNFGCGSSREHAPIAVKASGISCVIAESFARIFYRNAINIGLPILTVKDTSGISENDMITADLENGTVSDETSGQTFETEAFPPFLINIIKNGGLINSLK